MSSGINDSAAAVIKSDANAREEVKTMNQNVMIGNLMVAMFTAIQAKAQQPQTIELNGMEVA